MLSNLAETLHSSAKLKNKQAAKNWGLLKKQKSGPTMYLPEGLKDTPFCYSHSINFNISGST